MPTPQFEGYSDDASILPEEILYRMVTPRMVKWAMDGTAERLQSNAFQDYPESRLEHGGVPAVAVSVQLESVMIAAGMSTEDLLRRWGPSHGVAAITAAEVRRCGQGIVRWPRDGDPAHAMVFALEGKKKTNSQSKSLSRAAWVVHPPPRDETGHDSG